MKVYRDARRIGSDASKDCPRHERLLPGYRRGGVVLLLAAGLFGCGADVTPPEQANRSASSEVAPAPVSDDTATTLSDGPALWKVSDDDTTVYLFGTFHALKPGIDWFNGVVKEAYDAADEVALEATDTQDTARMSALVLEYAIDPDGRTLSSVVGDTLAAELGERLASLNMSLQHIEAMEPWMAVMTLAQLQMVAAGFDPNLGVDLALQRSAADAGKTLVGIEGAEAQLKLLDSFPEQRQIAWLEMSLRDWDEGPGLLNDMLEHWSEGDVDEFAEDLAESMEEVPNLNQVLLIDRNEGFADWIATRMASPGTVFVAVGAGHLAGPDSVQDFLREDGFSATRL